MCALQTYHVSRPAKRPRRVVRGLKRFPAPVGAENRSRRGSRAGASASTIPHIGTPTTGSAGAGRARCWICSSGGGRRIGLHEGRGLAAAGAGYVEGGGRLAMDFSRYPRYRRRGFAHERASSRERKLRWPWIFRVSPSTTWAGPVMSARAMPGMRIAARANIGRTITGRS